jgi:hypothetical protein
MFGCSVMETLEILALKFMVRPHASEPNIFYHKSTILSKLRRRIIMEEQVKELFGLISSILEIDCECECHKCPLNKQMTSEFYNGRNICDLIMDIDETLKEVKR